MIRHSSQFGLALALVVTGAALQAACGGGGDGSGSTASSGPGSGGEGGSGQGGMNVGGASGGLGGSFVGSATSSGVGGSEQAFDVEPSDMQTIAVTIGQSMPTVTFTATLNGQPISAGWGVDRGNIGTVAPGPSSSTVFTPSGTTGGVVNVVAGLNNQTVERPILVKLTGEQNGFDPNNPAVQPQVATDPTLLTAGGGIGGVGGDGLGPGVADMTTLTALQNPSSDGQAEGLTLLYPYDKTVWPRGLLAPLVMWRSSLGDADAVRIDLKTTTGSFAWTGTFARPNILAQTGKPFIRHPIPQDIWEMATSTAGGADKLTMSLTIAKSGQAYGPISQTWTVAPARLSGTIYYNSYGTQLAKNYGGAVGGDKMFGGAVLSIKVGDTGPALTAGANGGPEQCRVCHSVSADGSRLISQRGDNNAKSSLYELSPNGSVEVPLAIGAEFPGMYHDGSMALAPNAQLLPLPDSSVPLMTTGLTSVATSLGTPAFSPDGKLVTFNPMAGPGVQNPKQKLVVMSFDVATMTFSNPTEVVDFTGQPAEVRPGWAAFFPDGKSVVFHHQSAAGIDGNTLGDLRTRKGAKARLAWASASGGQPVTPLDQLNGVGYLPKLDQPIAMSCIGDSFQVGNIDADHADDVNLNYEPTVNPIASGGYAWVVFTSRRMYGSVATIPPFCSDPRGVDLVQNITPKKLWVAAIDLNAQPGVDASHPAFYLPGQELLAGNSRGFWVLDPCRPTGESCQSGDQCCDGYCQPVGPGGALVCSNTPPNTNCSQPQEKCSTAADCCDGQCINGFCAENPPS